MATFNDLHTVLPTQRMAVRFQS